MLNGKGNGEIVAIGFTKQIARLNVAKGCRCAASDGSSHITSALVSQFGMKRRSASGVHS